VAILREVHYRGWIYIVYLLYVSTTRAAILREVHYTGYITKVFEPMHIRDTKF
jgi:hypothetical protein